MRRDGDGKRGRGDTACSDLGHRSRQLILPGKGEDRLLRIEDGAKVLAISVRAFYRLIADGELPGPVKIGRASRIPMSDLQAYMEGLKRTRRGGET